MRLLSLAAFHAMVAPKVFGTYRRPIREPTFCPSHSVRLDTKQFQLLDSSGEQNRHERMYLLGHWRVQRDQLLSRKIHRTPSSRESYCRTQFPEVGDVPPVMTPFATFPTLLPVPPAVPAVVVVVVETAVAAGATGMTAINTQSA